MAERKTLIHPATGGEYVTDSPVEINDLVYGRGYRIKQGPASTESAMAPPAAESSEPAPQQQEVASEPEQPEPEPEPEQARTSRSASDTKRR
jgi:hypothetical protein